MRVGGTATSGPGHRHISRGGGTWPTCESTMPLRSGSKYCSSSLIVIACARGEGRGRGRGARVRGEGQGEGEGRGRGLWLWLWLWLWRG
eukprot:5380082-Prymnesium_polylepis.2